MRAFLAINLPPEEREQLHATIAPLRALGENVRWTAPDALHLTLEFLGNIEEAAVARVVATMEQIAPGHGEFDLVLGGIGAFPNMARPRVWWVGAHADERLLALHADLERALEREGFSREERPYSPHVTIGRAKQRGRANAQATEIACTIGYDAVVRVKSVDLMESRPTRGGVQYHLIRAAVLGARSPAGRSVRRG